ncbi:hypothetical protein LLG38_11075 [bacterium]|nr:hypothetical protein [bacterium]
MNTVSILTIVTITFLCLLGATATTGPVSAQPGDIITINASCSYILKTGTQNASAECTMIVGSTLRISKPVYVTNGWRRVVSSLGEITYLFSNPMTDGVLVRGFVLCDGAIKLVDGIQTSDGKILVDGTAYSRVQGPGG